MGDFAMIRRGITLTEVLVAIFVTGMGLMALMTLFPLGALNMSLAIKDDRASHAAANASAMLRTVWRRGLDSGNPNQFQYPLSPQFPQPVPLQNSPAYLDPINLINTGSTSVAGVNIVPRIGLAWTLPSTPASRAMTFQYFSLMDDIEFDFNGKPIALYGNLPRETLYSWAYMLRPPFLQTTQSPRVVEYSVVIYNRRSVVASGTQPPEQFINGVLFNANNNYIKYPTQPNPPKISKGSWVLDISVGVPPSGNPPYNIPHAYFYRVNSVTVSSTATQLTVDQPLRGFDDVGGTWPQGQLVIMQNVVEVFEKSTLE